MSDLDDLRPEELFALGRNPSATRGQEAIAMLRSMGSPLAKNFDPKPVQIRTSVVYDPPKPQPPADATEAVALLREFPVDRLMDIVSASGVYSKEIRLEAARLVKLRNPLSRYARAQRDNVSAAGKSANLKQIEGVAYHAARTMDGQYERKVQIRTEADPEFAHMMKEVDKER
jgi:hypothetical protein